MIIYEDLSIALKILYEKALLTGRHLQQPQTGLVHHYYGKVENTAAFTIPLVENVLFCLALLYSHSIENIQEAKNLLKRLFCFQHLQPADSEGSFPTYLHSYSVCHDPTITVQLLAPFYWIIKNNSHLLGNTLKNLLENVMQKALLFCLNSHQRQPFTYSFAIRLATAQQAYGTLFQNNEWLKNGQQHLLELAPLQTTEIKSTTQITHLLIGLQMIYPNLEESPWKTFWQYLQDTWHQNLCCYIGPCFYEKDSNSQPEPHLYNLYTSYFTGHFSEKCLELKPYHLYATLIQPIEQPFKAPSYPYNLHGSYKEQAWCLRSLPLQALTLCESKTDAPLYPAYTYLRFLWKSEAENHLYSLVFQGGEAKPISFDRQNDNSYELYFHLPALPQLNKEKQKEVVFFAQAHEKLEIKMNKQKSNTFLLSEPIDFYVESKHYATLVFELQEGQGDFFGHLMRGNRPSNHLCSSSSFTANDWLFFLRSVRRSDICVIKATFTCFI